MEKFADYILREKIHETRNSIIYRGHKENEEQQFIIKLLKSRYPTPSEIARFRQEYDLIKSLDLEGVIKTFDIINDDDRFALVLEDFNSVSIKNLLDEKKKFDLKSFLTISAKVAETLGNIHEKGVVHRDIKPHNLLINPATEAVKITDFGISTILTHENDEIYNPDFIAGTLAYMSPEQTGRMNRTVDYRTDLYSLGITLYEMITGSLPFKSQDNDPMGLIHSHIAVMPEPPAMLDSGIPVIISDMIMRLLAKAPEERYQNGFGLMADIRECIKQLEEKQKIDAFELGKHDISNRFIIPQKLFGREKEIEELISSFDAVANHEEGAAVMVVAGVPGVGKSALVNEIYKPIVARRGYFISGMYEQFRKDKPYSAIIQAFQALVKQILSENEERISLWKQILLNVLGESGKIITEVIPEVELIIGKQPDLPALGPEESRNRFNYVFEKFTSVFPAKEHPVALYLDDIQWADLASLQLLKNILTGSEINYFFLILSYRDKEVGEFHPVMDFLRYVEKNKVRINRIKLGLLTVRDIANLIKYFLRCSEGKGMELADLLVKKTGGNPFFVNQFLHTLYNEKMIVLEGEHGWKWDADKIRLMQVTDNLMDMMAGKIGRLSANTQDVLKICACIGNRFNLETLAAMRGTSVVKALADLKEAINEGLVSQLGDMYVFHHDRIQEAAYSLVPETEKSALHYKIGKLALNMSNEDELQKKLFYIVDQLNLGIHMIKDIAEREKLAKLNLEASQKAKASAAYVPAQNFSRMGIKLLPDDCWNSHYELTYSLYKELMECEYLTMNLEDAEKTFAIVVENAKSNIDKTQIHTLMVILYITQGNYKDALKVGMEGMRMVGMKIPENPSDVRVGIELLKLRLKFGGKKIEDLIDMQYTPLSTNSEERKKIVSAYLDLHPFKLLENPDIELIEKLSYAHLAIHTGTVAFYYNPNLFAYIAINGVCQLMDYEVNFEYSGFAYIALGSIIGSSLGFYRHGYRFGLTALKLTEKIADKKNRCKVEFAFAMFIQHWQKHAKYDLDYFREAYKHGMETGDMIFSGHNINLIGMTRIMLGDNIDNLLEEYGKYKNFQLGGKDPFVAHNYSENTRMCLCLKGLTEKRGILNGDGFDEDEQAAYYESENNKLGTFYFLLTKLRVKYLFSELSECRKIVPVIQRVVRKKIALGNLHIPEFFFYYSLMLTASYPEAGVLKKIMYKSRLQLNQMKMKIWARNCPENFEHKYLLVKAERARLGGHQKEAADLYDRAIKSARENQYTQNEAIANELAALFMKDTGNMEKASQYMKEAHYGYIRWGATAKVKDIEEKYPDLLIDKDKKAAGKDLSSETDTTTGSTSSSGTASSQNLDMTTVIKTSQTLSSEIDLGKLLVNIMKLSIENAGAQYGCLIMENDEDKKLSIMAAGKVGETIEVMKFITLEGNGSLSVSIVNYVHKTGENVVLGNASADQRFMSDPYVRKIQPKSILCAPIRSKEKVSGIIYLENNLTTDAFTPERLETLRILSAQAAISIENARLFELATTDGLTKLYVHRYFQLLLDQEMQRSRQHNKKFALIMMDIDNFKAFNDTYGHQLGDEVLRSVARTVKKISRVEDVVARYGGEEFVMILPETDAQQAMTVAGKIRTSVEELEISHEPQKLHVTISLGIAIYPEHAGVKEALIHAADAALYISKRNGKNRVSLFEKEETP